MTEKSCKKDCEVYSRIVGYFRPVQNWNVGKKEEFKNRRVFLEPKETGISQDPIASKELISAKTC